MKKIIILLIILIPNAQISAAPATKQPAKKTNISTNDIEKVTAYVIVGLFGAFTLKKIWGAIKERIQIDASNAQEDYQYRLNNAKNQADVKRATEDFYTRAVEPAARKAVQTEVARQTKLSSLKPSTPSAEGAKIDPAALVEKVAPAFKEMAITDFAPKKQLQTAKFENATTQYHQAFEEVYNAPENTLQFSDFQLATQTELPKPQDLRLPTSPEPEQPGQTTTGTYADLPPSRASGSSIDLTPPAETMPGMTSETGTISRSTTEVEGFPG